MPRGKALSEQEKGKILALQEEGYGIREIGRRMDRSHRVVQNFLKSPLEYGSRKRSGRKKQLTEREQRKILRAASNTCQSLQDLTNVVDNKVSRTTIWRTIKESPNIIRKKMNCIPALTQVHRDARQKFARENMGTNWNRVNYSKNSKLLGIIQLFPIKGNFFRRKEMEFRWARWKQELLARHSQGADLLLKEKLWWWQFDDVGSLFIERLPRISICDSQNEKFRLC